MNRLSAASFIFVYLFNVTAFGAGTSGMPHRTVDLGDITYTAQNQPTLLYKVKLIAHCYGTNLRNVPDPLVRTSNVQMVINFKQDAGATGSATVQFPAKLASIEAPQGQSDVTVVNIGKNTKASYVGQILEFNLTVNQSNDPTKQWVATDPVKFTQIPQMPDGTFLGTAGSVHNYYSMTQVAGQSVVIDANFPGQLGWCGSYVSPLMVFFTDERPSLTHVSQFPLRPEGDSFYWPEGSKNYAFLVYDSDENGKINRADQLFGSGKFDNGFEALAQLDSNHDGKIDKNDAEFSKIKLWYDLNGNGVVDPGELKSLPSAKIDSIPLKYSSDRMIPFGERGQFREYAIVKGKRNFEIIDVWFGVKKYKDFAPAVKEHKNDLGKKKT